ncbi:sensor histidine kinase [Chryseobacterium limigenitum]|uniref:histidine kinase n=1 Tax=Chryseobacterium limigenitum TaxID=1612149 RepID=A0A1K2IY17_9FLAO|nr:ATP-binding protein [Chryseobacterium limigenitum]SFZ96683.1 histidine kinase [Chryseobacterium limigenitum]
MSEKIEIQKKLQDVIINDPDNIDLILSLSRDLALLDENNARFLVDAGVIDRLGKELVARHETAVSELVKNSFDADSTFSKIYFNDVDDYGGQLIIDDDGNGMSREQLLSGFMRISSTEKIHEPLSPIYSRSRAGRKGIGRFATQRLGSALTIITQTADSTKAIKLKIDWDNYSIDKDLMSISNSLEFVEKTKTKGTTLIIDDLRDWWSEAMIKRVYRYTLDIIQPFPISNVENLNPESDHEIIKDPGFTISCFKDSNIIADTQSMFYDHAAAEIMGGIDEHNMGYWKIVDSKLSGVTTISNQLISKDDNIDNVPYKFLKGVSLKAYYYIYNVGLIPKQVETYIDSKKGGIKIYRNGFRVLPYGEEDNDWVTLDESVRTRRYLFVHGNHNFFGFVEIKGDNPNFVELSSREGFLSNEAYQELVDFTYKCLTSAVRRIASERGIKETTDQKDWDRKYSRTAKQAVEEAVEILEDFANEFEKENSDGFTFNDEETKEKNREKANKAREKAEELRHALEFIDEINMLRVLAGLGVVIGEFTHEIFQYLTPFEIDTQFLLDNLPIASEEYEKALDLQGRFKSFRIYASYFDETISENVNRELKVIDLRHVINPFFKSLENDLLRNNIALDVNYLDIDLYTCKMHPSEWASILFNLYSNSKKAMKRRGIIDRKIKINAGKLEDKLFVEFLDNGDGIPFENREKIFDAFFTTSSPRSKSNISNELSGTGLGLKIIKDIIESYQGEITVENPEENYSTNIRIEIPIAKNEDIPNDYF